MILGLFFGDLLISCGVLFTFGKEGKLQENKQREEKQKKRNSAGKETLLVEC